MRTTLQMTGLTHAGRSGTPQFGSDGGQFHLGWVTRTASTNRAASRPGTAVTARAALARPNLLRLRSAWPAQRLRHAPASRSSQSPMLKSETDPSTMPITKKPSKASDVRAEQMKTANDTTCPRLEAADSLDMFFEPPPPWLLVGPNEKWIAYERRNTKPPPSMRRPAWPWESRENHLARGRQRDLNPASMDQPATPHLLDRARDRIRLTETRSRIGQAHRDGIECYIHLHGKRRPRSDGPPRSSRIDSTLAE